MELIHAELIHAELIRVELIRVELIRVELIRVELIHLDWTLFYLSPYCLFEPFPFNAPNTKVL